jgi:hypothetical protein
MNDMDGMRKAHKKAGVRMETKNPWKKGEHDG